LRGDEWLNSVPLHVNLYNAFGWEMPIYAHLPLILDPSGEGKLSKRKRRSPDGDKKGEGDAETLTYIHEYRDAGYLPDAMFNFLASLGWSYSPEADLFTREQAIEAFDIHDINTSPAALPLGKLDWMNGHYIRALSEPELTEALLPFLSRDTGIPEAALRADPALPTIAPLVQERIKTLDDAGEMVDFVFAGEIVYDPALLIAKGLDAAQSLAALEAADDAIRGLPFAEEALEPALRALAERLGLKPGQLFGILRVAVTGKTIAPPLFGSMMAVGRERTLGRIEDAEGHLRELAAEPASGAEEGAA
jgi:glutamyl-tRNA synthetase